MPAMLMGLFADCFSTADGPATTWREAGMAELQRMQGGAEAGEATSVVIFPGFSLDIKRSPPFNSIFGLALPWDRARHLTSICGSDPVGPRLTVAAGSGRATLKVQSWMDSLAEKFSAPLG